MGSKADRCFEAGEESFGVSAEVALRIRAGDPDAVQLVRDRVQKIIRFRGLGVPPQQADDLEQEIVTQVWQAVNRPSFEPTSGFWGFVEVVTARRCIDWLRSRRDSVVPLSDAMHDLRVGPLGRTLKQERSELAAAVVQSLGPGCRQLLSFRFDKGLSYHEIAERTGKSEGALRVKVYRCIQQAQKLLRTRIEEEST